jgi:hypothetical protein
MTTAPKNNNATLRMESLVSLKNFLDASVRRLKIQLKRPDPGKWRQYESRLPKWQYDPQ